MKIEHPGKPGSAKLSLLIYGLTGSGKTWLCGTAQDCAATSPTLIMDVGGGTTTLAGRDIDIVRPGSLAQLQEVYDFLRHDNDKYKSVCLDGLTAVQQELSMPEIQGIRDPGEEDDYSNLAEAEPPERMHWLRSHEHIRRILRAFRDLCVMPERKRRLHVLMTCLEKKDENRSIICPQLPGVLGLECGAYIDVLAQLTVRSVEKDEKTVLRRHLLLEEWTDDEDFRHLAKNRGGKLGPYMWNPTIEKLLRRWSSDESQG